MILVACSEELSTLTINIPRIGRGQCRQRDIPEDTEARSRCLNIVQLGAKLILTTLGCGVLVLKSETCMSARCLIPSTVALLRGFGFDALPGDVQHGTRWTWHPPAPLHPSQRYIPVAVKSTLKAVHCGARVDTASAAFRVLLRHAPTLEEVTFLQIDFPSPIIQLLESCPNLHSLMAIDTASVAYSFPQVDEGRFGDWDPRLQDLRPWACMTTFETLAINIVSFHGPSVRPQWTRQQLNDVVKKHRTQQKQVSERLGSFTNLRTLTIERRSWQEDSGYLAFKYFFMSSPRALKNRLKKLARLTSLRELNFINMPNQRTEMQEVEWMVENLPSLRRITGLRQTSDAFEWLQENHSKIQLE